MPAIATACPTCGTALEGTDIGRGFNMSILFLIVVPLSLVLTTGLILMIATRRAAHEGRIHGSRFAALGVAGQGSVDAQSAEEIAS